ncbi:MutS protein msh4 [Emydomyces testavorans]|uniref:MutS protein msh4 n=1 Tax=Emydomyces testavorans TaxID=2070801 RepID=A0AAF0DQ43_9EURO|nr:MutS protein msh4 [Emydomyces testavorans]
MPSISFSSKTSSGWSSKSTTTGYTTTSGRPRTGRPTTTATSVTIQDIICAISESRGICPTVGLAFVNLSTSEAVLCQICDSQTYARTIQKLAVLDPTEILFMRTAKEPRSKLYSIVEENLPQLTITATDRRYWAEKTGHEYVEQLAFKDDLESIKISLEGNYFAACCLAAALTYIELELSKTFASHSLRIKYEPSDGSMMIDLATIISLELIQNLQNAKSKDCLFGVLNETLTPMGSRLLRSNILQPSTETTKLSGRYDAVEELGTREDIFHAVREGLLLCAPSQYDVIGSLLDSTLNADVTYQSRPLDLRNQRTYAIKAGVNGLLDIARQTYKEANKDVNELASRLGEAHNLALDLRFETARQYYFRLPISDLEDRQLPDVFINVYRRKNYFEFQTVDLVRLNQKITDSHNEVINMSDRSIQELIEDVRAEISILFRISEGIAMLDMLAAFAQLVAVNDYVRPELTDTLAIKAGRHPIREKIHSNKFIPNDAYATQQSRFQIITGCNMSGKSTYIRSLALMTVMAQIGCFVPAQYASFPIVNQLFARISADDNVETNVSTFSAEMREMAFILRNIGPRSMVIVDELGRGTSTVDGLSIAIAISEALVDSHALVWFATHFHDLARIMSERNGVVNLHLAVEMSDPTSKMTMLYKIADGYVQDKHYGLALARLLSLPPEMLKIAQTVSEKLSFKSANQRRNSKAIAIAKRRQLLLALREQLLQAKNGMMGGEELRKWLKRLQDEFTLRMAALDAEIATAEEVVEDSVKERETEDTPMLDDDDAGGESAFADEMTDLTSPMTPDRPPVSRRTVHSEIDDLDEDAMFE